MRVCAQVMELLYWPGRALVATARVAPAGTMTAGRPEPLQMLMGVTCVALMTAPASPGGEAAELTKRTVTGPPTAEPTAVRRWGSAGGGAVLPVPSKGAATRLPVGCAGVPSRAVSCAVASAENRGKERAARVPVGTEVAVVIARAQAPGAA